jgi:hypothetical protein
LFGDSSAIATSGCDTLPLTLCAGVGRVEVEDVMEVEKVTEGSEVLGEKLEGL